MVVAAMDPGAADGHTGLSQRLSTLSTLNTGAPAAAAAAAATSAAGAGGGVPPPPGLLPAAAALTAPPRHAPATQAPLAPASAAACLEVSDEVFAAYLEDCVLSDFAVVASAPAALRLAPRSAVTDWTALANLMQGLGFYPDHADCWSRLGAVPTKSAKEQTTAVGRRLELARTVLALADGSGWSPDDRESADAAGRLLAAAADDILRELASCGGRRGQGPPSHRLCQELGCRGLEFLLSLRGLGTLVATQCSTHLEVPARLRDQAMSPSDSAPLWVGLCSSSSDQWWQKVAGHEVVIWSPAAADEFGRLLGGFVRHVGQGHRDTSLKLVCPVDDLPGCSSPSSILQHWMHPGLGERWAGVLAKVEFVTQPVEQVSPGGRFAQVSWRQLGLLTFRCDAVLALPTVLSMDEPGWQVSTGIALCVDFPSVAEPHVLREVAALTAAGWELAEPRRSPASQRHLPRLRLTLGAGAAACTPLDAAAFAQRLSQRLQPHGGVVARTDIMTDDTALILHGVGSETFALVSPMCTEVLPLSPRAAVVRTRREEAVWEEEMRRWQAEDPKRSALQLRFKRLVRDGGLWVSAPGTAQRHRQLAAGTAEISSRLVLQLRGPDGPRPARLIQAIQDMVSTALGSPVTVVRPQEALSAHTLRPDRGVVAGAMTGRMELAVKTPAEARHLHELLHGRGVQLGSDLLSLEVLLTPLTSGPGNGRRC